MKYPGPATIGEALKLLAEAGHQLPAVYSVAMNRKEFIVVDEFGAKLVDNRPGGWVRRRPYNGPLTLGKPRRGGPVPCRPPEVVYFHLTYVGWEPPNGGQYVTITDEAEQLAAKGLLPKVFTTNSPSMMVVVDAAGQHLVCRRANGWATRTVAKGPQSEDRRVNFKVAFGLLLNAGWQSPEMPPVAK